MQSRELQRKVMKPGETAAVTKCGILRRFALRLVTLLLFGFTLTPGAQQNQSSPQELHLKSQKHSLKRNPLSSTETQTEAIRILSSYLQTRPKDSAARTLLGQAYASIGQNERAEEELHGVLQVAPNDSIALAALGEIYEREGQPEKPNLCWRTPRKLTAATRGIRMEWAVVLVRLHKYAEAQSALAGLSPPMDLKSASGSTG